MIKLLFQYIFFFFLLISCTDPSEQEYNRIFNYPLQKEINQISTDDYRNHTRIIEKYMKTAEEKGYEDGKAHCYMSLAVLNIHTGNFKKAALLLKQADDILKQSDNTALKAYLYNTLALFNYRVNNTDKMALAYNTSAMQFMKKSSAEEKKIYQMDKIYEVRADFMSTMGSQDSANIYHHKAINSHSSELNLVNSLTSLAELKFNHFKMDSTGFYINKALSKLDPIKGKTGTHVYTYYTAGTYYSQIKQYQTAEVFFNKALLINNEISYSHLTPFLYMKMEELYRKTGDKDKENRYAELTQATREQMFENRNSGLNAINQNLIIDTTQEKQRTLDNMWTYISLLAAGLAIVSLLVYRRTKRLNLKKESLKYETKILRAETEKLKNQFNDKRLDEVIALSKKNDSAFLSRFTDLYPDFIAKLKEINPELEKSELIFCAMIKLNYSSKEIARNMVIQHTSAQKRKSRIRKRLNIPSDVDIYDFFDRLA